MLENKPLDMKNIRGWDCQGNGAWLAPRGSKNHQGEDPICKAYSSVKSHVDGVVTKIGKPYDPNCKRRGHLRYVEVTATKNKVRAKVRYFYINPAVSKGQKIKAGDELGISSDLSGVFEGITQHVHVEVIEYVKPSDYFERYNSEPES